MKKILISLSIFISLIYLSLATDIVLNSGQKLDTNNWTKLSSVLNKVDISGNNVNINGKFNINGKICDASDNCLGICKDGKIWDTSSSSCISPASTPELAGETCKTILDEHPGIPSDYYYIDPDGKGTGTPEIKVWCDMEYDGGGWTRYLKIASKYTNTDSKSCWLNSAGKTSYGGLSECFNPNRYNMTVSKIRVKINGNNYTRGISGGPSVSSAGYSNRGGNPQGRECIGHPQYMVIMTGNGAGGTTYANADYVWLGLSMCLKPGAEVGGNSGSTHFMSCSNSGVGPACGGREGTPNPTTEIYIR